MTRTLWLDIEDLLHHLRHHSRPSGIQRVVIEISRALHADPNAQIRFLRRNQRQDDLITIDWPEVEALLYTTKEGQVAERAAPVPDGKQESQSELLGLLQNQLAVIKEISKVPYETVKFLNRKIANATAERRASRPAEIQDDGISIREAAAPGDLLLVLGSPWHYSDYASLVRTLRDKKRMYFGLLIHDLIPILHPEWCDPGVTRTFTQWHDSILPLTDIIFANSRSTAKDIENHYIKSGLSLPCPVTVLPFGSSFSPPSVLPPRVPALADAGNYVLFVSTIEARKNHELAFRVWRRMTEQLPAENIPTLVFAGRVGWLVADLMQQLDNAHWLKGKIRLVTSPSDEELESLYANCLCSLFPSFFEGWGLPVTESLGFGKPCLVANSSALPEAGGEFSYYFNPRDISDAYEVISSIVTDPVRVAEWALTVKAHYSPVTWSAAAKKILTSSSSFLP